MTMLPEQCPHCGMATMPDEDHCGWCGEFIERDDGLTESEREEEGQKYIDDIDARIDQWISDGGMYR